MILGFGCVSNEQVQKLREGPDPHTARKCADSVLHSSCQAAKPARVCSACGTESTVSVDCSHVAAFFTNALFAIDFKLR